jgi:hypothetical protein
VNVSNAVISSIPEVGWHYCLNKANLRNKVVRHSVDGDAHFIHPDDTRTWIPDGATFACRTRAGVPVVDTRWREYITSFRDTGWDYCYDNATLRNSIVKHNPGGDAHFVDDAGVRHYIASQSSWDCLLARGTPQQEVRWREYITATPEREWAVCGSTLYPGQKLDRGQFLNSPDNRYRLRMQSGDGHLVLYNAAGTPIWYNNRTGGSYLVLQSDGNMVIYNASGGVTWTSNTAGQGGVRLVLQSDGNLVLYSASRAVWSTNTVGR